MKKLRLFDTFLKFILLASFILPAVANGQAIDPINNPFGGFVTITRPCTCSSLGNFLGPLGGFGGFLNPTSPFGFITQVVTMIPAKPDLPINVIYQPGISRLFEFRKIEPGVNVLGTWLGVAPCLQLVPFPPFCIPDPVTPLARLVTMIGTSGGQLPDGPSGHGPEQPPTEPPKPACSDSIDNDNDGKIDFPNDDGCTSATDQSEDNRVCNCNCNAMDEDETRSLLRSLGIAINKAPCRRDSNNVCADARGGSCTNVRCLPRTAIDRLRNLKNASSCNIILTGGTEENGVHETHGQCRAIVDLGLSSCLNNYITQNATAVRRVPSGTEYRLPDGRYVRESNHWHVIY